MTLLVVRDWNSLEMLSLISVCLPLLVKSWRRTDMASDGAIHILSRGPLVTGCDDDAEGKHRLLALFNLSTYGTQGSDGF